MKKGLSCLVGLSLLATSVIPALASSQSANNSQPDYNYSEALQKSILFYEYQMSGKMPENLRINWKGDSCLDDGSDVGLDLTGGWYDAGDHVKFNLPMSYTAMILGWTAIESGDYLKANGEYQYLEQQLRWANDYFIKCHPNADEYYFQVGDGNMDHSMWVSSEVLFMDRPSYKVTVNQPGSAVCAETAASLAVASIVFKDSDPAYSAECIEHSKQLLELAEKMNSDSYYDRIAGQFYKSWSGFYDELSLGYGWLYKATGDSSYLTKAESYADKWGKLTYWDDYGNTVESNTVKYDWTISWDDVTYASALLLAELTDKNEYHEVVTRNLDYWTTGNDMGAKIKYTPKGLAYCDGWGALRYASNASFLALLYAENDKCSDERAEVYREFAKSQIDYALGSTGRSYVCGFGENAPENPHHRSASGVWSNNVNAAEPATNRHVLVGALVGGPSDSDVYVDNRVEYTYTEVACDYNACFTGALAKLSEMYGGTFLDDVNGNEESDGMEFEVSAGINYTAVTNGFELRNVIYNHTAWPARITDEFSYRIYVDISDVLAQGYAPSDMNMQFYGGTYPASISEIRPYDEANGIYYYEATFTNANGFYPGGEGPCKCELQYRITAPCEWAYENSPCYQNMAGTSSNNLRPAQGVILYEDGVEMYNTFNNGDIPVNKTPTAKNDSVSTDENTAIVVDVLANDTDRDGSIDANTLKITSNPSNGTATVNNGKIEYVPADGFYGNDSFTYTVNDNEGAISNNAAVTIEVVKTSDGKDDNVTNPDDGKDDDGKDDNVETPDDDNDDAVAGEIVLDYQVINEWGSGFDGKILLTNNTNSTLSDWKLTFDCSTELTAMWTGEMSSTATGYAVTPKSWNNEIAPGATVALDFQGVAPSTNTLKNIVFTADGFTYSFGGNSDIEVPEPPVVEPEPPVVENAAPAANDDYAAVKQDTAIEIDVLANDSDADGFIDADTIAIDSLAMNGSVSVNNGKIVYTPANGFSGTDSFTYNVKDNSGAVSNTATVTVTVEKAEAPVVPEIPEVPAVSGNIGFEYILKDSWNSGYNAEFVITNNTNETITNWWLTFDWSSEVGEAYTGTLTKVDSDSYSIGCMSWNAAIAPGTSVVIQFQGRDTNFGNDISNIVLHADNFESVIR